MGIFRTWWARLRGESGGDSGFRVFERPDGSRIIVDQEMSEYLNSTAPDPKQQVLDAVLGETHGIRVFRGGSVSGQPLEKDILFEGHDRTAITTLGQALRIVDGPGGHCMCHGDPTIELLDASDRRLAVVSVHHGRGIRWDTWRDDAELVAGRSLLEWLADRGVRYPLDEYRDGIQREEAAEERWNQWVATMPACLERYQGSMRDMFGLVISVPGPPSGDPDDPVDAGSSVDSLLGDSAALLDALEEAYPVGSERALVLFAWLGSGTGPWTGYPAYERVPEGLLATLPISDLLRALDSPNVTTAHLEGAARLFAGWAFGTKRTEDLSNLPGSLRRRLLEHSMESRDPDKRSRALAVFQS